jgi:ABC-type bacteriocin/lantibiotic exporter with double-glycine peptidase domain
MGIGAGLERLRRSAETTSEGTTLDGLKRAAESVGSRAEGVQMDREALARLDSPAVTWVDGDHNWRCSR